MVIEVPTALEGKRRQRRDVSAMNAGIHWIIYDVRCIRYPSGV
jgi:hypothetical protein